MLKLKTNRHFFYYLFFFYFVRKKKAMGTCMTHLATFLLHEKLEVFHFSMKILFDNAQTNKNSIVIVCLSFYFHHFLLIDENTNSTTSSDTKKNLWMLSNVSFVKWKRFNSFLVFVFSTKYGSPMIDLISLLTILWLEGILICYWFWC